MTGREGGYNVSKGLQSVGLPMSREGPQGEARQDVSKGEKTVRRPRNYLSLFVDLR